MMTFKERILSLLDDQDLTGVSLIDTLKEHPLLRGCYAGSLKGRDNHTLEEHTLMALHCYERNFQNRTAAILEPQHFKLLFAFHDLGKPRAMQENDADKQHQYTLEIIDDLTKEIRFPESLMRSIITVIDADPIGRYLNSKHNLPIENSLQEIGKMANNLGVPIATLWPTLMIYYQCDAAGYNSLRNKVFITDEAGQAAYSNKARRFIFKDQEEARRFEALEGHIATHTI